MKLSEQARVMRVIDRKGLGDLFSALKSQGYTLVGPRVIDQAIVHDEIQSITDLPIGLADRQSPGEYRLERREDEALFGYVVGPHSWKKYLFPPLQRLYQVECNGKQIQAIPENPDVVKRAFIAVRPCELAALAIQDEVFTQGSFVDTHYESRRSHIFIVAVNCGEPASTCFCASMSTGPEATQGFDLALTEVIQDGSHEFIVQVGSDRGEAILQTVNHRDANNEDLNRRKAILTNASKSMGRSMQTTDLKELLYRNYENSRWETVAQPCLSCANCTMVCPTCFCSTVEDVTDLTGNHAERWRKWDSCFTMDFSYIVGGSIRSTTKSRYRQWLMHKLATWQDQFGMIGCVGCGRCITWCPVGIDLTQEVAALRASESPSDAAKSPLEERYVNTKS